MLAVEKWGLGKPLLIALCAPQIAALARDLPDMLRHQKMHRLMSHTFPVPDLRSWCALYRSHRRYFGGPFIEMIAQASPYGHKLVELGVAFQDIPRHLEKLKAEGMTPEELKAGQAFWNELLRMSFTEARGASLVS